MRSQTLRYLALGAATLLGAAVAATSIPAAITSPPIRKTIAVPARTQVAPQPIRFRQPGLGSQNLVRVWTIHYNASDRTRRAAFVVLPRWYGPRNNPPIPLVISPHGRSVEPQLNARLWGNLPALGSFAVVNPEGQGNRLELISWGAPGQIADLSEMPQIVTDALPWLRIAPHRIYAVGTSMGGQETLLLLAQHPRLLAGAAALDSPTNLAARYAAFRHQRYGLGLQRLARLEFGGTPLRRHDAYADRSPLFYAREIARSAVPLQIWWSTQDRTVVNQAGESGLLYRAIRQLNPHAPVTQVIGTWAHSTEFKASGRLPIVLAGLGLIQLARA